MGSRYGFIAENRPRDAGTVFRKFLEWNVFADGKRLSSMRGASCWYRDDIYYNGFDPAGRIVHAPGGEAFVFLKRHTYFGGRNNQKVVPEGYVLEVDYLGVASPYEEPAPSEVFLQSVLSQCVARARYFVETIAQTSPRGAAEYFREKAEHDAAHKGYQHFQWMYDGWSKQIDEASTIYHRTKEAFELGGPSADFLAMQHEFWAIIERKAAISNSPANVKKRERFAARQEAMRALNLEEKKGTK